MQIIKDTINFRIDEPTVVTIGKFDGIHKGHAAIFERMKRYRDKGLKPVVFTFDMPVSRVIHGINSRVLTTRSEKRYIFDQMGVEYLIEFPFNEMTASISAEEFIDDFMVESMNMKAIVMGRDCRFGHRGVGTPDMLARYAHNYGYEVEIVDKLKDSHDLISSTRIREFVEKGDIVHANELLLYPYFFYGTVVEGNKLGRTIGIPTINLIPREIKLLPPNGVYYSQVELNGERLSAITNIGRKPTLGGTDTATGIETYIYDFNRDIYGEELTVSLYEYVRPEMKFNSLDELKQQLDMDIGKGEKWHKNNPLL